MCPTRRFPASVTATIDGVVLYPPRLGITTGVPFSTMATHEFVVPRSMPMTFSIRALLLTETNPTTPDLECIGVRPKASCLRCLLQDGEEGDVVGLVDKAC